MFRTIFAIAALVVAGAAFFLYTKPHYDALQSLQAQSAQYDEALTKAAQLQSIKQSLLSRYNSFDPTSINRLQTMLPDQVDNIRLILDLDNIAAKYGMALQNVDISTPSTSNTTVVGAISAEAQQYDSLTLQFTTQGTYSEFKQFIGDLQSSLRIVDIINLSISPSSGASQSSDPSNTYNVTLKTYWLR